MMSDTPEISGCPVISRSKTLILFMLSAFFGLLSTGVYGAGLVIKTDGDGFWVDSMTQRGAFYDYISDKQKKGSIPQPEVAELFPTVERGKPYTAKEIQEMIEKIEEAVPKYLPSRKHLMRLKGQWEAAETGLKSASSEAFDQILVIFKQSPRGKAQYEKALLELQMLQFKDAAGAFDDKVAEVKTSMIDILLGISLGDFERKSEVSKMRVPEYELIRDEGKEMLKKELPKEIKERIQAGLDTARTTTLDQWIPYGKMSINAKPSIESYMRGRMMLVILEESVAETGEEKQRIKDEFSHTRDLIKTKFPKIDLSLKQFVLFPSDVKKLATSAKIASTHELEGLTSENEYAFIIPTTAPAIEHMDSGPQFLATVVFDRAYFKPMEYSLAVAAKSGTEQQVKHFPLKMRVAEGHGRIMTRLPLEKMPGVRAYEGPDGKDCVYVALAVRPAGKFQHGEMGWETISKASCFYVGPKEK